MMSAQRPPSPPPTAEASEQQASEGFVTQADPTPVAPFVAGAPFVAQPPTPEALVHPVGTQLNPVDLTGRDRVEQAADVARGMPLMTKDSEIKWLREEMGDDALRRMFTDYLTGDEDWLNDIFVTNPRAAAAISFMAEKRIVARYYQSKGRFERAQMEEADRARRGVTVAGGTTAHRVFEIHEEFRIGLAQLLSRQIDALNALREGRMSKTRIATHAIDFLFTSRASDLRLPQNISFHVPIDEIGDEYEDWRAGMLHIPGSPPQ